MNGTQRTLLGLVGVAALAVTLAYAQNTNLTNLVLSGNLTVDGTTTLTGAVTYSGAQTFNGQVTLGDGGDTVAINSSAWDITAAGAGSGFTSFSMVGPLGVSGGTINLGSTTQIGTLSFLDATTTEINLIQTAQVATAAGEIGLRLNNSVDLDADDFVFQAGDAGSATLFTFAGDGDFVAAKDVAAVQGIFSGAVSGTTGTFSGDVTVTDAGGFNGDTGAQLAGITSVALDFVVGTAGRTEAQTIREDGETTATWDEITCAGGANTCVAVPSTDDAVNFKFGATAQSITIGTMVATDTIGMAAFAGEDWEALENVGLWMRADSTTLGTDWRLQLIDDGGTRSFALEAITVANQWQFVEADISSLAGGTGDVITRIMLECNHASNCNGITFKIDNLYVWDTDDETALNFDILDQPGAVGSAWSFVTLDGGAQTHARTRLIHGDTIAGSATDFVIDPDDNTLISVDDNSASTIELLYHRAAY